MNNAKGWIYFLMALMMGLNVFRINLENTQ